MRFLTSVLTVLWSTTVGLADEMVTLEAEDAVYVFIDDETDRKTRYKFVYYGEFSCGAPMQKAGSKRFQSVEHGKGFRLDGQYVYPCDDVIRRRGTFLGREWGWELTNGEWRIDLNRSEQTMTVRFRGKELASGFAEFDPPVAGSGTSSSVMDPQL